MRYYAAQILYFMGIPHDVIVSFDPIFVLFVVVFSTELLLIYLIFLMWAFGKRGSIKKYDQGLSGFPKDMMRRVDTSNKKHRYDLSLSDQSYDVERRKGFFGAISFLVFMPTVLIFIGVYAYSLYETGALF